MISKIIFMTKVKSLADIMPVWATKTASPVIPLKSKIVCKFEKIGSYSHDQRTCCEQRKWRTFSFICRASSFAIIDFLNEL